ncbi:hypothetical protein [Chitinilyticum piscinae]|uniref:hypothetical protein n=1 Tax=Chitinilyticum piscinae TaxID=2866724 RepID=UPI001D1605BD|nr:hypothetical protein [Chitinilyticum piscinae]
MPLFPVPHGFSPSICLQRDHRDLLVHDIDTLRRTVRLVRQRHPFHIDSWGVLPEHRHAVLTLTSGNGTSGNT